MKKTGPDNSCDIIKYIPLQQGLRPEQKKVGVLLTYY